MVTVVTNLLQQEKLFFILQLFSSPQLPCSSAFRLKVSPESKESFRSGDTFSRKADEQGS